MSRYQARISVGIWYNKEAKLGGNTYIKSKDIKNEIEIPLTEEEMSEVKEQSIFSFLVTKLIIQLYSDYPFLIDKLIEDF